MNSGMIWPGPGSDEYETPPWLFKALDTEFGFDWDAAARPENAKCSNWTGDVEAVRPPAGARVFCNPPYSKIDLFVSIALDHVLGVWVLLVPNRTGTAWFQRLSESGRPEFRFLRKRVCFYLDGKECTAPRFDSIVAIIRGKQ